MTPSETQAAVEQLINDYKPSPEAVAMVKQVPFLQLIGISGAGKGTIGQILLKTGDFRHIISHTTRPPRTNHGVGEVDGADYHFIDMATAVNMLERKSFIEAKWYSGNIYGTSVFEFELAQNESKIALTDIDIQGAEEYLRISTNVFPVFLLPPDYETWMQRLKGRYADAIDAHQADIQKRLITSKRELTFAYHSKHFMPIINLDSAVTARRIESLLQGEILTSAERKSAHTVIRHLLEQLESFSTLDD
jgi:guanylate kinase